MRAFGNQINRTTEADRFTRTASTIQVATKMACTRAMELNNSRMAICIRFFGNKAQWWARAHVTIATAMSTTVVLYLDDVRDKASCALLMAQRMMANGGLTCSMEAAHWLMKMETATEASSNRVEGMGTAPTSLSWQRRCRKLCGGMMFAMVMEFLCGLTGSSGRADSRIRMALAEANIQIAMFRHRQGVVLGD